MNQDIQLMKKVLELAQKGQGFTSPNPLVGALIVKNGKIIAKGYHKKAGLPHAEIEAMRKARTKLRGATLYLNLEPCCHFGRTPPCVDKIIESRIKKVVVSSLDPNPRVYGKSLKKLRAAGIKIDVGILKKDAQRVNEVFFKNMKKRLPFVVAKVAQSLDGKITTRKGVSKWITSKNSRDYAKSLRDKYDCVLVGINTLIKDNPSLNGKKKTPFKAVIDPHLKMSTNCQLYKRYSDRLIVITSQKNRNKAKRLPKAKAIIFVDAKKRILLRLVLKKLYSLGITSVFVEGGSQTIGGFFDAKLVDKICFFIAPLIIGGKTSLTSVGAIGYSTPKASAKINDLQIKSIGSDFFISGYPRYR